MKSEPLFSDLSAFAALARPRSRLSTPPMVSSGSPRKILDVNSNPQFTNVKFEHYLAAKPMNPIWLSPSLMTNRQLAMMGAHLQAMAQIEKLRQAGAIEANAFLVLTSEEAVAVSAYLDKELTGAELQEFEARLSEDADFAFQVAGMEQINDALIAMGELILSEPLPQSLQNSLSFLRRKY